MTPQSGNKCKTMDLHNPGSFTSRQSCFFNCPANHDESITHQTERALYCECTSVKVSNAALSLSCNFLVFLLLKQKTVNNKRECDWKIKKKGFPELDDRAFKSPADYTEPLLWGVTPELKCKGATTTPPQPPLPAGSFCYFPGK